MKLAFLVACAAGCGGGAGLVPIDLSLRDLALPTQGQMMSGDDLAMAESAPDMAMPAMNMGCTTYTPSSVAAMRQAAKSGCFELDGVVTLAVTYVGASSKSVTIHAQDAAGGDYSAIKLDCSTTSTTSHFCNAFASAKNILVGRQVTVQVLYLKASAAKGGYESLAIDVISDT